MCQLPRIKGRDDKSEEPNLINDKPKQTGMSPAPLKAMYCTWPGTLWSSLPAAFLRLGQWKGPQTTAASTAQPNKLDRWHRCTYRGLGSGTKASGQARERGIKLLAWALREPSSFPLLLLRRHEMYNQPSSFPTSAARQT